MPGRIRSGVSRGLAASVATLTLLACGGGDGPVYELVIDGPEALTTTQASAVVSGTSFVPDGSTCSAGSCLLTLPPPVYGVLGPYTLTWSNAANGASGSIGAGWLCNCDNPRQSTWSTTVALARGDNRITVTMTDRVRRSQDSVTITRP